VSAAPLLSGIVIHWRAEQELGELVAAWPRDPRFELIVVDNESSPPLTLESGGARLLRPGRNLGFAGGANAGAAAAQAPLLLLLNPDACPLPGALQALVEGFAAHPEAAGLAPRLESAQGESQHRWQLRPLPRPWQLLGQTLFLSGLRGPAAEPPPGAAVEQPAGAALALRREALRRAGGFDERFHPAWFEDVDLARRLRSAGLELRYWPAARFRHALGASVSKLGYQAFLAAYYRNLARYLEIHHGRGWARAARGLLVVGALLRLTLLPLRRPRRARSRSEAARALLALAGGALRGG
jgi:GT2 family glycosyltransferase